MLDIIVSESKLRLDDPLDIIERIFSGIRIRFIQAMSDDRIDQVARETANSVDNKARSQFTKQFKTVFNVNPIASEPWLQQEVNTFVSENASLIKTLPTESLADIEQMVFRDAKRQLSPQQIAAKIEDIFETTESRARLIARDQVSKFNGRLSQVRQKQIGITRYVWQTSEDGRVRNLGNTGGYSDHARLNGKIFDWDNPPVTVFRGKRAGETNHPAEDIQCRCHALPVIEDLL